MSIKEGLEFAKKHNLTPKEIDLYLSIDEPKNINTLVTEKQIPKTSITNCITRLVHKKLINTKRQGINVIYFRTIEEKKE